MCGEKGEIGFVQVSSDHGGKKKRKRKRKRKMKIIEECGKLHRKGSRESRLLHRTA
jgi:hypothetical protein